MPRVQRLPDDLANQIAAGEVVERPASIVKELLENALDAQASRVRIDVEGGGIGLLRVSDDGIGMDETDARLALERHATSKIGALDDLLALQTFGFRGEALPSIASVSRFVLQTRVRGQAEGVELRVEGGGAADVRPCGVAPGTTVEVRDLFFNVPARRKFLKSPGTESGHITDVAEAIALGVPGVSLTLAREGRVVREWLRCESTAERVRGSFAAEELAELQGEHGSLSFLAFLSRPERARAASHCLKLFVNGRLVRDRMLVRTVLQAYGSVLPAGRYPPGVVFLSLSPDRVDVNVHPQKAEVRFADGRAVTDGLFRLLSLELGRSFGLAPVVHPYYRPASSAPAAPHEAGAELPAAHGAFASLGQAPSPLGGSDPWALGGDTPAPFARHTTSNVLLPAMQMPTSALGLIAPPAHAAPYGAVDSEAAAGRATFGSLTFLVQLRAMFLVCEAPDGLYILDQHAAAERVTYHRLKRDFSSRQIAVQPLLFPVVVEVSSEEAAYVEQEHALLLSAGVEARTVGPMAVAVHGVPQILRHTPADRLLHDLLSQVRRTSAGAFQDAIDMALATMACHGSVRAGDRMAPEEVAALLRSLDEVDFAGHCPHGRPIVTMLRWDELERKVGRRG